MASTSTNTDQVAPRGAHSNTPPRGALNTTDQLEPHSYADDPNDGVEADARAGSSDSYSLAASDLAPSGHDPAPQGKDGLSEALKAERRRSNNLEKELRGGDFQESCHSWAAIQAAWIKGSARSGSGSSVGLFIHTSAG